MSEPQSIGVIGIGNIGTYVVQKLLQRGFEVWAWDLLPSAREKAQSLGAKIPSSLRQLAKKVQVALTCLPSEASVQSVWLEEEGILFSLPPGSLGVDMSTSPPSLAREMATQGEERGLLILDAPVSWGEGGLNIMVGGSPKAFEQGKALLATIGSKVTYVGEAGSGQVAKLVNQIIMAGTWAVISEAFAFAQKMGVDRERVLEAINTAGASSRLLNGAVRSIIAQQFSGGGLALHTKDLRFALSEGREKGVFLPFTALLEQIFTSTLVTGEPNWPQVAICTFWDKVMNPFVSKPEEGKD